MLDAFDWISKDLPESGPNLNNVYAVFKTHPAGEACLPDGF
jgi:hypothetical protein